MTASVERRSTERPAREIRHRAREAAVQMLYQWEVGKVSMVEVGQTFWTGPAAIEPFGEELRAFAMALAGGVVEDVADIDPMIAEAAQNWRIERMNVLDRLILRLAVYEFLHEVDTPAKVIINEALELARTFSGEEPVPLINGVLDAVRKTLKRDTE